MRRNEPMNHKLGKRAVSSVPDAAARHNQKLAAQAELMGKPKAAAQINPDAVVEATWKWWTPEAKWRQKAVNAALAAKLSFFEQNLQAFLTADQVMTNAVLIQVMGVAENFIIEVRAL